MGIYFTVASDHAAKKCFFLSIFVLFSSANAQRFLNKDTFTGDTK